MYLGTVFFLSLSIFPLHLELAYPLSTVFNITVQNISRFFPIEISVKDTLLHYNCFFSSENG